MALADATRRSDTDPVVTPIDQFLAAQADLRVVERFARADVSGRTGRWSDLIPLSAPGPGEQYRFEVDLDSCTGCKACVTACHSLNGLDETESFRSIGLLLSPAPPAPIEAPAGATPAEQTITTACHHCLDPGCLNGCPAEAYEKDPVTGIVKHLDDACIGCQYCTLTCPYDVPVYNDRLGIVRKCDLCADRLAHGEAPACVQGCPTSAISVTTVSTMSSGATAAVAEEGSPSMVVPGAAPSHLTAPTTRYRGRLVDLDDTGPSSAVDPTGPKPQHSHLPLVATLVLSQWSVGLLVGTLVASVIFADAPTLVGAAVAATLGAISAAASFAHLGQPLKAWRAVLGWRHSWLSREVLALSAYIAVVTTSALLHLADQPDPGTAVGVVAVAAGLGTVGCSIMIYVATGRRWWRLPTTAARFGSTVAVAAASWLVLAAAITDGSGLLGLVAAAVVAVTVGVERRADVRLGSSADSDLRRTALLLDGPLAAARQRRLMVMAAGAVALVIGAQVDTDGPGAVVMITAAVALLASGELVGRRLFFQACAPRTMPGAHR